MRNFVHVFAAFALAATAAAALGHDGDVGLSFLGGRITIGIVTIPGPGIQEFVLPGQRVFGAEFTEIAGSVYAADPGFFSGPVLGQTALTLPASSTLRFNILGSLMRWDEAAQNFSPVTPGERLRLEFAAGALTCSSALDGSSVSGFGFDTGPTGGFDEHYDYYLDAASGQTAPAAGIYAIALDLYIEGRANSNSLPYYTVFNYNADDAQHDAAIEYVANSIIPTPTAASALILCGGLLVTCRRRR